MLQARALLIPLLALLLVVPAARGHALLHETRQGEAIVVQFFFADGDKPYFETYRVLGPDNPRPFQSGRINAVGEVSFRPDRPGIWRVLVATEDGHGAEVRVGVDADALVLAATDGAAPSRVARLGAAIGYLFGAFGIIAFWRLRRARRDPS